MGQRPGLRGGLGVATVTTVGHVRSTVAIVVQSHERTSGGSGGEVAGLLRHRLR